MTPTRDYAVLVVRDVVSMWSSGTGGAGIFGSLSYAGLTQVTDPRTTVLILTVVPVIMFVR